jgi:hypothetical protein
MAFLKVLNTQNAGWLVVDKPGEKDFLEMQKGRQTCQPSYLLTH